MTTPSALQAQDALALADRIWEHDVLPTLSTYIEIPCRSPAFDGNWRENGQLAQAAELLASWCRAQGIPGLSVEVLALDSRPPVIFMELPGKGDRAVLLYGHYDKQPEGGIWREGLGPWKAVREGDRLYGRGAADDGYSVFAVLAALRILREQGKDHARCVVLIEGAEESGSAGLPAYVEALRERIGEPNLVVCLDAGAGNYDQLWLTTSLRGVLAGVLTVRSLVSGVHSGVASGIVPSTFRIVRRLLSRIEDEATGRVLLDALHVEVPPERRAALVETAKVVVPGLLRSLPWADGTQPMSPDLTETLLNQTWRPALSVTGASGMPPVEAAGNVLRPLTSVKLSMRIPPRVDAASALRALKAALESDPPYGAEVSFTPEVPAPGWDAAPLSPWLDAASQGASLAFFGNPRGLLAEGASIPFMAMLSARFPKAELVVTGVLGPHSNAHGPNELLHLPMAKKLTCCVATLLAEHIAG
jgi:acetylornithine deacetylase/succinyl-diaminopimelate desuccinylase-like protein